MLDEQALRRPDFRGGVPIRLSDGQEWHFPAPVADSFYPWRNPSGTTEMLEGFDLGPEYDALVRTFSAADDADTVGLLVALSDLAYHLLALNYALGPEDLAGLLRFRKGDGNVGANRSVWGRISAVALGRTPEPESEPGPGETQA